MSFREAGHLPNLGGDSDPAGLPRQRRGITPQMHGRYPDYDVLEQAEHWDDVTQKVVLDRVHNVPAIRFFEQAEAETLKAFCDVVTHQPEEPRIPVLSYVDEKLFEGKLDGYQYEDMPDDRDTWRIVARGLDEEARRMDAGSFLQADEYARLEICKRFAHGNLSGGAWDEVSVKHAWSVVTRMILSAFYAHPWAWNEIGFGGPAYPRGYSRFGSPHLQGAEREEWEGKQAFDVNPVEDTKRRGLE